MTTPLEAAPAELGRGRDLYLKREDVHELGAFKWRAALPVVEHYRNTGAAAVVTASTGNHGAATAWAAAQTGLRAVVFAPEAASRAKLALLERFEADVRLVGADMDEAKEAARRLAKEQGIPFFEDGAEPLQYDAYEAIGGEIVEQLYGPAAAIVVPVGNGALLGGIGRDVGRRSPSTLRVGVVPKEAPVMADSWEAGEPVAGRGGSFADGLAVRVAIPYAVEALAGAADRMLRVSERDIALAVAAFDGAGIRAEGAAAAALAALPQLAEVDGPVVIVVTGRNIDDELLARCREEPGSFRP